MVVMMMITIDDIADEEAYMNFLENGTDDKLKDTNVNWNKVHVEFRKVWKKQEHLTVMEYPT